MSLKTAVAIAVFNRPEHTGRLMESLRMAKPRHLFVVADGARRDHGSDADHCRTVLDTVDRAIDWPCEVRRNISDTNLGCGRRIATGLDWVFEQVEEAIILEDDCIPDPSFFRFCEEMLVRYRDDDRIVHIGGNNFQGGIRRGPHSYFFSRYNHIWGWATWRRAWKHFDHQMRDWPAVKAEGSLRHLLSAPGEYDYWSHLFDDMAAQEPWPKTWGYAWTYACFKNGLSVYPNVNLVSNIGFGEDATHCTGDSPHANLAAEAMDFPLSHPSCFVADREADVYTVEEHFGVRPQNHPGLARRWGGKLRRIVGRHPGAPRR